jgi:hypothetical protein
MTCTEEDNLRPTGNPRCPGLREEEEVNGIIPIHGEIVMRLQWKPSLENPDTKYDATDEATGITVVVEWDDSDVATPWRWYLTNYPIVSREPADNEGPTGRASTKQAATEAATEALPTFKRNAELQRQEKKLYESEQ